MAITKASASGLAGSRFKDASAGTAKIVDVPDQPTITSATNSGGGASISFSASSRGGIPTNYTVTSSPGSVTNTGSSSPIIVTGLTPSTAYTFTVRAETSTGNSPVSNASNTVTTVSTPTWQESATTFTSTQNYTPASSVEQFAMVAFSGGGNGGPGSGWGGTNNGGGGGGAGGSAASGVATSAGYGTGNTSYLVTIGASGSGVTSVGNFLNSNATGNANSKVAGNVQAGNGTGGNIQVGSGLFTTQNYQYGGAGGSGGWGGENQFGNGSAGQSPYGGSGGKGGNYFGGGAGGGGGGNQFGGGGGGGGGAGYSGGYPNKPGAGGGSGFPGRVIIFEKKSL